MPHRLSVTVPSALYKKIEKGAHRADRSISSYVCLLVELSFLRLAKLEEEANPAEAE